MIPHRHHFNFANIYLLSVSSVFGMKKISKSSMVYPPLLISLNEMCDIRCCNVVLVYVLLLFYITLYFLENILSLGQIDENKG